MWNGILNVDPRGEVGRDDGRGGSVAASYQDRVPDAMNTEFQDGRATRNLRFLAGFFIF
jgi:hypothetical protein